MSESEFQQPDDTEAEPEPTTEPEPEPEETEPEQPDVEPEPEPEPVPPEARETTPEEWERRITKAEKLFATYTRRISELWEEDATYLVPVSISPSAPPGFLDVREAGRVDEATTRPVLEFFGFAREQDYEPDPQTRECSTCKGKGKTKTGSHVAGRETRPCPTCNGSGAEGLSAAATYAPDNGQADEPFTLAPDGSEVAANADNWGEPPILPDGRENPNYGKQPQFKVMVEPWGITAGLTAQDVPADA